MRTFSLLSCLLILLLAACQRPSPPDPENPPEPKAMTNAIKQPLDRAHAVEKTLDDAAKRSQQAETDADGGTAGSTAH